MSIVTIIFLVISVSSLILTFLPPLPPLNSLTGGTEVLTTFTGYFQYLCKYGSGILGFFVDNWVLVLALTISIAIFTAEPIYYFIHWLISKIPWIH